MSNEIASGGMTHCGLVKFETGKYLSRGGTSNWHVQPIAAFGQAVGPPLGQVKIYFDEEVSFSYLVLVCAERLPTTPMIVANYGEADKTGFVVHLFEVLSTKTLQNGNFSFAVYHI